MHTGIVYILTHPFFAKDVVKIGMTSRRLEDRIKELSGTSVPTPFEPYATLQTAKYREVEAAMHDTFDELTEWRINARREFFKVKPEVALRQLLVFARRMVDDAVVTKYVDGKPQIVYPPPRSASRKGKIKVADTAAGMAPKPPRGANARAGEAGKRGAPASLGDGKRLRFRFEYAGVAEGDVVVFDPTGAKARVVGPQHVEYEGVRYSTSGFTEAFLPARLRHPSGGHYCGPQYFSFQGETLYNRFQDWKKARGLYCEAHVRAKTRVPEAADSGGAERNEAAEKRPRVSVPFTFSELDISAGDYLVFEPTRERLLVVDEREVHADGRVQTLAEYAVEHLPAQKRGQLKNGRWLKNFTHAGETLEDRRARMAALRAQDERSLTNANAPWE